MKETRYVVEMHIRIMAKDDHTAKYKARKLADKIGAEVTEIGEQPFASMTYRKLEDLNSVDNTSF